MIIQEAVRIAMKTFEQKISSFASKADAEELTADLASDFSKALQGALAAAGQEGFRTFIESYDPSSEGNIIEIDGQSLRWKMISLKNFLTPFGKIPISRSLYQADSGGPSRCPLDDFWGMSGESATEDVREASTYAMAHMTAEETEHLFSKCAWFHPSATAIRNMTNSVGELVETHADDILPAVQSADPLPSGTDILVASMDGVNVLLREQGSVQGRPAERPQSKKKGSAKTAYRNAMTGVVSCYALPADPEERPKRLQSRYTARMPQKGSVTFKGQFEQEVMAAEAKAPPGTIKLFLCDGHRGIWTYAQNTPLYNDYEKLVDFYHTTEHLSKASEALFGKNSRKGQQWYQDYRLKLLEQDNAAESIIRSIDYHLKKAHRSSGRRREASAEKTFFRRNRHLMKYADFLRRGLPIGSGPVEAACKSIVKTRLCRSGMRWSRQGGQYILDLRCFVKSNRWDMFWKEYVRLKRAS